MSSKKKDKQNFLDDILSFLAFAVVFLFAVALLNFSASNPYIQTLLSPDNFLELGIFASVCLCIYLFISYLNREVV